MREISNLDEVSLQFESQCFKQRISKPFQTVLIKTENSLWLNQERFVLFGFNTQ